MFIEPSNISGAVDSVFLFILAIAVALLLLVTFFMIYFVVKYRREKHPVPVQVESNTLLEVLWVVVPTVLVLAMFFYGWSGFKMMRGVPKGAMEIRVIGQMWAWTFIYQNGKQTSSLNVPVNKAIKLLLTSRDVIHSFYIPAFRVKEDALPNLETYLWFRPTQVGNYDVFCAEYCGTRHSYMLTKLNVMPEEQFKAWYDGKEQQRNENKNE